MLRLVYLTGSPVLFNIAFRRALERKKKMSFKLAANQNSHDYALKLADNIYLSFYFRLTQ